MIPRRLATPEHSVFLLGPRGVGKSTWLAERFPSSETTTYDLLDSREALRLSRDPAVFFDENLHLPERAWVVVDEVQKVPGLLDEVHRLIERRRLRFVLCGSSARKLRRAGVNLLAGRVTTASMFPLVSAEVDLDLATVLANGTLPMVHDASQPADVLRAYVETYLREEVQFEALTRQIGAFARFLEIAALHNGQVTNISNIARESQVARQTVATYFEILVDTLIGYWLPAWRLKKRTRQIAQPKFYFFDSGVVRAAAGRSPYPPSREELGPLLETYVLHELRAFLAYSGKHYPLFFWGTHQGAEVDVLFESRKGFVALALKSNTRWDKRYGRGLARLSAELGPDNVACYGVYLGERRLRQGPLDVLPCAEFTRMLWDGELID